MSVDHLHRACDRCHGQKLRCRRQSNRADCIRCIKANALCTTGEFRAGRRSALTSHHNNLRATSAPDVSSRAVANQIHGFGPLPLAGGAADSWMDNQRLSETVESSPVASSTNYSPHRSPHFPGQMLLNPSDEMVARMAERRDDEWNWEVLTLNTPTTDCSTMVPNGSIHDGQGQRTPPTYTQNFEQRAQVQALIERLSHLNLQLFSHGESISRASRNRLAGGEFPIDETFSLSQELAGTLRQLSCILKKCHVPNPHGTGNSQPSTVDMRAAVTLDRSSMLFVLSVYSRLINVYDKIFVSMQHGFNTPDKVFFDTGIKFPALKVGSFSLSSSSLLQIATIAQLAENILTQVRETIQCIETSGTELPSYDLSSPSERRQDIVDVIDGYLRQSEDALRTRIRHTVTVCMERSNR